MNGRERGPDNARRRSARRPEARTPAEPVLIAARRPNAPAERRPRSAVAASAAPRLRAVPLGAVEPAPTARVEPPRRAARIVQAPRADADAHEKERLRLTQRLLLAEGRGAITRAATELRRAGHGFPGDQVAQLQLLEHNDETIAREAVLALTELLRTEPLGKRPVLEQRLRRLEETGEEAETRDAAAALRRALRG